MGIWIKKSAHGKKYGREAMHALKKWADEHLTYEWIVYQADKNNISSRKIPESLGATVHAEYDKPKESGGMLNLVEYRIYPR